MQAVRACGVCGRERTIKRAAVDGDPDMCQACWKRDQRSWRVCGRCGELRPTQGRDSADRSMVICQRCYRHARPAGICDDCGRTAQLARTGARGGSRLCGACADRARRPARECGRCEQVKPVATRQGADGTEDLCFACYGKTPRRVCGGCGEVAAIQRRARDGAPDLCVRCYRLPIAHCSVCGREKPCSYAATTTPLCGACKPRRVDICAVCGEQRPIKAADAIGPLSGGCEWRMAAPARKGDLRALRPASTPGAAHRQRSALRRLRRDPADTDLHRMRDRGHHLRPRAVPILLAARTARAVAH